MESLEFLAKAWTSDKEFDFDGRFWQSKRVVVLGASRGVGREIVRRASAEGAQVLAVARQARGLAEVAKTTPGVDTLALDAASTRK